MSLPLVVSLLTKGYGLRDDDFDEIIRMDHLKDVSSKFSKEIHSIQEIFNSKCRIRLIEFNEFCGSNEDANKGFNLLIFGQRHVFYSHIHSNKDCCVVFLYSGKSQAESNLFRKRTLPHEFAHHFQWAAAGFPCLLPKSTPEGLLPQFAKFHAVGPKIGSVYIDGALIENFLITVIKDFSERISDFICDSLLLEKGVTEGFMDEYKTLRNRDPAKAFPIQARSIAPLHIRYSRRLCLRDVAEWQAFLHSYCDRDPDVKNMMDYDKRWVIRLNKDFVNSKDSFNRIYEITRTTDYNSFKEVTKATDYLRQVMHLLNIGINTDENG